jgi:hypothetical protein
VKSVAVTMMLFMFVSTTAAAEDSCVAVLALTGRDLSRRVDTSELRSYLYKSVCGDSSHSLGFDYQDAARLIGVDYADRNSYCNTEKQFSETKINNQLQLATVVRESVQAWLQCKQFKSDEIELQVNPGRQDVSFSLKRLATGLGMIYGLEATNGTACSASFVGPGKNAPTTIALSGTDGFALPTLGAASIYCTRKGSSDQSGITMYPETAITIKTSAKNFAIKIPEESLQPTRWATEVRDQIAALRAEVTRPAPIAMASVSKSIPFPYAQTTRVVFDNFAINNGMEIASAQDWHITIPREGLYLILASINTNLVANARLSVVANKKTILEFPAHSEARGGETLFDINGVVSLKQGDSIWVEAAHSMHATAIVAGRLTIAFVENP